MGSSRLRVYYVGFLIILAAVIGGGTDQGLWSDNLIATLMVPAIVLGFQKFADAGTPATYKLFLILLILFILSHFLPFARPTTLVSPHSVYDGSYFFTLSIGRSLSSALYLIPLIGLFLFVLNMKQTEKNSLINFILLAVTLNMVAALFQFSATGEVIIESFLPYEITAGFMANENHFSTLAFMSIPILAWKFLIKRSQPMLYITAILFLVFVMFVVGSRAGMAISTVSAVICFVWFSFGSRSRVCIFGSLCILAPFIITVLILSENTYLYEQIGRRIVVAQTILPAIGDHWLLGTGIGSFAYVYPVYEQIDDLGAKFAYHVHNDYLELMLEGGVIAAAFLVSFLCILIRKFLSSDMSEMIGLAILMVLIHSVVDYPLRTYAVSVIFVVLCTMMFSVRDHRKPGTDNA